jgi:hypothetical protein
MIFKLIKNQFARGADSEVASRDRAIEYEGFTIIPAPRKTSNGWTTEGDIEREVDGEARSEHFIRAETHTDPEQAISHTITKAKRIIDEQRSRRS